MIDAPLDSPLCRRVTIFPPHAVLRCPNGHKIREAVVIEHNAVRCQHRYGQSGECGKLVYLLAGVTLREGKGILGVEVTADEMQALKLSGKSPVEILSFLGLSW